MKKILLNYYYFYLKSKPWLFPSIIASFLFFQDEKSLNLLVPITLIIIPLFLAYYKNNSELENSEHDILISLPHKQNELVKSFIIHYFINTIIMLFLLILLTIYLFFYKYVDLDFKAIAILMKVSLFLAFVYTMIWARFLFKKSNNYEENEKKKNNLFLMLSLIPFALVLLFFKFYLNS